MKEYEIRDYFFSTLSKYGLKYGKKELIIEGLRIDIFAIGKDNTPYIIEFKREKNKHIVGQSAQYLSLVPKYIGQIEKEIDYNKINWMKLCVLCIAPDFYERDYTSAEYEPLKGKIHFYKIRVQQNNNQILALYFEYSGPKKYGPLNIPNEIMANYDLIELKNKYFEIKNTIARNNYYTNNIEPLFNKICSRLIKYKYINLFKKTTNWKKYFEIGFSTNNELLKGASIMIRFLENYIEYGFDIHNYSEGTGERLFNYLHNNMENIKLLSDKILKLDDYYLWIPSTGNEMELPIRNLNHKDLELLLNLYKHHNGKAAFCLMKHYKKEAMSINDIMNIINTEYLRFKFIIEIIV